MSAENSSASSHPGLGGSRLSVWLRMSYESYLGILLVGSGARVFGLA